MSPLREPSAEDPMELVGMVLPRPMDGDAVEAMARTFVEEYALMGWPAKRILAAFRQPFYGGAHEAYRRLGEERIVALLQEVLGPREGWSRG